MYLAKRQTKSFVNNPPITSHQHRCSYLGAKHCKNRLRNKHAHLLPTLNKCSAPKSPDLPGHNQFSPKVIQHEDNQFSLTLFKNANKTMRDSLHLSSYNASTINKHNWLLKMAHPTIGTLHLFFMRSATDLNDIGDVG